MLRFGELTVPGQIALVLAVILGGAVLTRSVTAELNQTVGTVWPFSLAHCHVATTPGCGAQAWPERHEATR